MAEDTPSYNSDIYSGTSEVKKNSDSIEIPIGSWMKSARNNPWSVTTFILAVILLLVIIFKPFGGGATVMVTADVAGQNALNFINSNPQLQGQASLISVSETDSFYEAVLEFQGNQVPVYITFDGKYLLAGAPIALEEGFPEIPTQQAPEPVEITADDDAIKGDVNAPIEIIEFSDFQCPFCGRFYEDTLSQLDEQYIKTGIVKFVYRDYPLPSHSEALIAAEATECVREKGGDEAYWNYHDKLFDNQININKENLIKWAKEAKYDITKCLEEGTFTEEVKKDLLEGQVAGVSGTPTFFINGKPLSGAQPFSAFQQVIEAELALLEAGNVNEIEPLNVDVVEPTA
jgi:protein-disulfide isomerase